MIFVKEIEIAIILLFGQSCLSLSQKVGGGVSIFPTNPAALLKVFSLHFINVPWKHWIKNHGSFQSSLVFEAVLLK